MKTLGPAWKPVLIALLVLAAGGGGWWGWRHFGGGTDASLPTAVVRRGELLEYVRCDGQLWVRQAAYLRAPHNAQDLHIMWLASAGKPVRAGQVVIRFDSSELQEQMREQQAEVNSAGAELRQSRAQARLLAEQDRLGLAQAKVAVEEARLEAARQAILSPIDGAEARLALRTAEAALQVEQATVVKHQQSSAASITRHREALMLAQAKLQRRQAIFAQTVLRAPVSGVITYMSNNRASFANPQTYQVGDQVFSGAIIAEIPVLSTLEMRGNLVQADRGQLQVGETARMHINALPDRQFHGRLYAISPLTEVVFNQGWPPPRFFIAYASIRHPDPRLRPLMKGDLEIITRRLPHALILPARALFILNGKTVVYLRHGRGFQPYPIRVVGRNPQEIAIDGLAAGATVALQQPGAKAPAAAGKPAMPTPGAGVRAGART